MNRIRRIFRWFYDFLVQVWEIVYEAFGWFTYPLGVVFTFSVLYMAFFYPLADTDTPDKITVKCVEVAPNEWEAQT